MGSFFTGKDNQVHPITPKSAVHSSILGVGNNTTGLPSRTQDKTSRLHSFLNRKREQTMIKNAERQKRMDAENRRKAEIEKTKRKLEELKHGKYIPSARDRADAKSGGHNKKTFIREPVDDNSKSPELRKAQADYERLHGVKFDPNDHTNPVTANLGAPIEVDVNTGDSKPHHESHSEPHQEHDFEPHNESHHNELSEDDKIALASAGVT